MMDINEALMELEFEANDNKKAGIETQLDKFNKELNRSIEPLFRDFNNINGENKHQEDAILLKIKEFYFKRRYLFAY